jgi:hypothetical protein
MLTDEQRTEQQRTDEQQRDEQQRDEQRTDEQRTDEQRTDEQRTGEQQTDKPQMNSKQILKTKLIFKNFCTLVIMIHMIRSNQCVFYPAFGFCLNQMCFLTTIIVEVNCPCKILYIIST